jgi:F0F1-type ATP synthase assembly protein I
MDRRLLALRLLGLGWYVAICVVAGAFGGIWLDKVSGFTPLFTLLGVLMGTVAAFYGLYKMVLPLLNNDSSSSKSSSDGESSL